MTARVATLWQAWTAPAARAVWSPLAPGVTVEFLEADTRVGGREVSLCKVAGQADIRVGAGWIHLQPKVRCVNHEVVCCEGSDHSAALITAGFTADGASIRAVVTVQLSSLTEDMVHAYQQGFGAGMADVGEVAERTMVLRRVIKALRRVVWGAWVNPETLPQC